MRSACLRLTTTLLLAAPLLAGGAIATGCVGDPVVGVAPGVTPDGGDSGQDPGAIDGASGAGGDDAAGPGGDTEDASPNADAGPALPKPTGAHVFTANDDLAALSHVIAAVGDDGSIFAVTMLISPVTFHGQSYKPSGSLLLLTKLDKTGKTIAWVKPYSLPGGSGAAGVGGIAVDKTGNVYVTGYAFGDKAQFGNFTLTNPSGLDQAFGWVASFSSNDGSVRWAMTPSIASTTQAFCGPVDTRGPAGEIVVSCTFEGKIALPSSGASLFFTSSGGRDSFVAVLDSGSGQALWATQLSGTGQGALTSVTSVTRAPDGNVVVSGESGSTTVTDGVGSFTCPAAIGCTFVARMPKVGPGHGIDLWKSFGSKQGATYGPRVAVTTDGTIALCMRFFGTIDFGKGPVAAVGSSSATADIVALGLDAKMTATRWVLSYGGTYGESCADIAADSAGNVVVGGVHASAGLSVGGVALPDPPPRTGGGSLAGHIFKVDPTGHVAWAYGVTTSDPGAVNRVSSVSIAQGHDDVVYAGNFAGHVDLGDGSLTTSTNSGKYQSAFVVERGY